MTRFVGKVAISSIFDGFVACLAAPPGAVGARRLSRLWRPVAACGGLWGPVGACGTGVVALLEDCILEAWSPGGLEPGDLEARMMRLRMRMLMNDGRDED